MLLLSLHIFVIRMCVWVFSRNFTCIIRNGNLSFARLLWLITKKGQMELWWLVTIVGYFRTVFPSICILAYRTPKTHKLQCNDLTDEKAVEAKKVRCKMWIYVRTNHGWSLPSPGPGKFMANKTFTLNAICLCIFIVHSLVLYSFVSGQCGMLSQFTIIEPNRHHIFLRVCALLAILCELSTLSAYNS